MVKGSLILQMLSLRRRGRRSRLRFQPDGRQQKSLRHSRPRHDLRSLQSHQWQTAATLNPNACGVYMNEQGAECTKKPNTHRKEGIGTEPTTYIGPRTRVK